VRNFFDITTANFSDLVIVMFVEIVFLKKKKKKKTTGKIKIVSPMCSNLTSMRLNLPD